MFIVNDKGHLYNLKYVTRIRVDSTDFGGYFVLATFNAGGDDDEYDVVICECDTELEAHGCLYSLSSQMKVAKVPAE